MYLFIKSFIVGIGKIIPGVSGAMLAIHFKIYEKMITSLTHFFDNWLENLKYLLIVGAGIGIAVISTSNIILYLLTYHKFVTMLFFIGIITSGTYNFSQRIIYSKKNYLIILCSFIFLLTLSLINTSNNYELKNNYLDNIIFFIGGIIEIFASIVPGISGSSLLMMIGIYNHVLELISNIYSFTYIFNNLNIYISYSIGMVASFIINTSLISYLLRKYQNTTYSIILGFSLASIIFLIIITIQGEFTIIDLILGIMFLVIGLLIGSILEK